VQLEIRSDGLDFYVVEGWLSPSYGRREPTPLVRTRRRTLAGNDVTAITLRACAASARQAGCAGSRDEP
jgi:hypothetical protein